MTFKKDDWESMCQRLQDAQEALEKAREDASATRLLDTAVWNLWTFGEYAINVVLELRGLPPDQSHGHAGSARDLKTDRTLQRDYSVRIEQLERYRLKAFYKNYSKERSTHYSPRNVSDCLEEMRLLQEEVRALLVAHRKL